MRLFTNKDVRRLWLTAVAAVVSLTANAQFTATVQQYPTTDYSNVPAEFKLTDVAQALGTDTATLVKALDTWAEAGEEAEGTPMFQIKGTAGVFAPATAADWTGNIGEMWMDAEGNAADYGDAAKWYAGSSWDVEKDLYAVYVGQMPEASKGGEVYKTTAALNYGGKQVTFDITYNIMVLPDAPEPATVKRSELDKLTLVGEQTITAERFDHQGYDALELTADLSGVAKLLGTNNDALSPVLPNVLFTNWYDTELGVMKDSLTNETTSGAAPGWWLRRTMYPQGHEHQGELSDDLGAADYGADCSIYLEAFKLDPATSALTCNLGQYPGTMKAGENVNAEMYIIYGDKYYKLNYKVSVIEAPAQGLDEMTSVGSATVEIEINDQFVDYQTVQVELDVDAIAEALGVEVSGLEAKMLKDENSLYVGNGTANNGGFWVDENGFVCNWGDTSVIFWEPVAEKDYSVLNVGIKGIQENIGATYENILYFVSGDKYYTVTLNVNVVKKEGGLSQTEWEIVAKKPAVVQVIASSSDYIVDGNQIQFTLTVAQAAELIGTDNPILYIMNADSIPEQGGDIYAPYTKYLCSPAPGVWINKDGRGQSWAGNEQVPVGICWNTETGKFSVYQVPNVNQIGSTFNASVFLVNEETGKMIEIPFTIQFVASLESVEKVGEANIKIPVAGFDQAKCEIQLEQAATALGVTVDDLMNKNNYYFKGMLASGMYSDATSAENGLFFNLSGEYDDYGAIALNITKDADGKFYAVTDCSDDIEAGFMKTGAMCFEVNGKMYVYNITFMDLETYITGISNINANSKNNGKMYNLQGVEIKQAKGLFIKNGKVYNIK